MIFRELAVLGVYLIEPQPHVDGRGSFERAYCMEEFSRNGIAFTPVQANIAISHRRGTIRGLHYQLPPHGEQKWVRCTRGAIFDVVLDMRPKSPTYGQWLGVELDERGRRAVFVPAGVAHGYQTLRDDTEVFYAASARYAPEWERGVRWDDPAVKVRWPIGETVLLSEKDRGWPALERKAEG